MIVEGVDDDECEVLKGAALGKTKCMRDDEAKRIQMKVDDWILQSEGSDE